MWGYKFFKRIQRVESLLKLVSWYIIGTFPKTPIMLGTQFGVNLQLNAMVAFYSKSKWTIELGQVLSQQKFLKTLISWERGSFGGNFPIAKIKVWWGGNFFTRELWWVNDPLM